MGKYSSLREKEEKFLVTHEFTVFKTAIVIHSKRHLPGHLISENNAYSAGYFIYVLLLIRIHVSGAEVGELQSLKFIGRIVASLFRHSLRP